MTEKLRSPGWRVVYFIQGLISRLAPPLHSLHWKILALMLVAIFVPTLYFLWQLRLNIEQSHLRSTEVGMIVPSLLALGLAGLTSYLLSSYLTKVITDLAKRADRIAAGEPGVQLETWTKSELGDLARAVETMRRKLEGKSYVEEMVATFSHELKTPLAAIRGATEIVEDSGDAATREKFLNNIRAEVDRLTRIVTNLLALSRLETQPVEEDVSAGLAEVANEVAETYRRRAETLGLRFEEKIGKGGNRIAVPEEEVRSILEILLDNAFQFTPRGNGVTLLVSGAVLGVLDEGVGIETDLQPRVFDRFMTTVNPLTGRRGTGLGLAIVQSIALRHHGVVTMKSIPGAGSEFSVKFPESS